VLKIKILLRFSDSSFSLMLLHNSYLIYFAYQLKMPFLYIMKKILCFAGSNSRHSINTILVNYVANKIIDHEVKIISLLDYELPMYSLDLENERSFSADLQVLRNIIKDHDALIISVNEHNGSISAFFKNHLDWLSRLDRNFLEGKKVLLMSTSPGARGAKSALEFCKLVLPRFGAEIVESFSFPSFQDNFSIEENKITNDVLEMGLNDMLSTFEHHINL
tara:strand:- start:83104 stop:83763 length:660 start_codon:yes stop_codon:yes gene_type:complete